MKTNATRQQRIAAAADKARELFVACKIGRNTYRSRIARLIALTPVNMREEAYRP